MDKNDAKKQMDQMKRSAEKELERVKKQMADTSKKVEDYIKKNPAKASVISAGIGAALGAAMAMFMRRKK